MSRRRDIRRCAVQVLYQLDTAGVADLEHVRASLEDSPGGRAAQQAGFDLALLAWEFRDEADAAVQAVSDDWPTHRQPVLDRNILRLAHYELTRSDVPPKAVINEAVELAREFSTEKSHLFINGVLDKIVREGTEARRHEGTEGEEEGTEARRHEGTEQKEEQ